ncbi:MAG: XRE family transcriptional regulator [Elusimicrobiales bacterium]
MKLGAKIALLLKERAMTKIELAKRLGLRDSSVVSHWVRDRFHPDAGNRRKLADVFEKPLSYFDDDPAVSYTSGGPAADAAEASQRRLCEIISALETEEPRRTIHVGVIGSVSGENFNFGLENPPTEYLPVLVEAAPGKKVFALKARGSWLEPAAREGDYIVISQCDWVDEGRLAVVRLGMEFTIKRIFRKNRRVELRPDNPSLKTVKLAPHELNVVGQVLAVIRKP